MKKATEVSLEKKYFRRLFLGLLIGGCVLTCLWLGLLGNTPQKYHDLIYEYTAIRGSNKTIEMNLLFFLIGLGCISFIGSYILFLKRREIFQENALIEKETVKYNVVPILIISCIVVIQTLVTGYDGTIKLLLLVSMLMFYLVDKNLVSTGLAFYLLSIFAICGAYHIYVYIGGQKNISSTLVGVCVWILSACILSSDKRRKLLSKGILLVQIFIPSTLLIYLMSKYQYNGEIITIELPVRITIFIIAIVTIFTLLAIRNAVKKWNIECQELSHILFGSCASILIYSRFSGSGAIISSDLHHPFENIIGFSQIFELGQMPFEEYVPVSGMYSIIHGAVFRLFGLGEYSNYAVSQNIFYLLFSVCVVALLFLYVSKEYALILCVIYHMLDYNRIVLIVPIMLILAYPKLIERKNLWLKIWILTSLIHGLYYPLYGAAVLLGFLPLGIWQCVTYIRSGQLKQDAKTKAFWGGWVVSFIPVILSIPLLIGMYKQMRAMSSQSLLADGASRFGQLIPDFFMKYLSSFPALRQCLHYSFTFVVPALLVVFAVVVAVKLGNITIQNNKLVIRKQKELLIGISVAIFICVSYTSTFIRLDPGSLYARTMYIMFIAALMLFVYSVKFSENKMLINICAVVLGIIIALILQKSFLDLDLQLKSSYVVPEGYQYEVNEPTDKLGTVFMSTDTYNNIKASADLIQTSGLDREKSYIGVFDYFGKYYLNEIKGSYVIEPTVTVKGFEASQDFVENAYQNESIIGTNINPIINYYLCNWLLTSGDYIWDAEKKYFTPNTKGLNVDEVYEINKQADLTYDKYNIERYASSFGSSIDTLSDIFIDVNIPFNVSYSGNGVAFEFKSYFDGDDADFIYIEFDELPNNISYTLYDYLGEYIQNEDSGYMECMMKTKYNNGMTVNIVWKDDNQQLHTMYCSMDNGKLLIPLGAGKDWLLNQHNLICITVSVDGVEIPIPQIASVKLLKLQEVGKLAE